MDASTSMSTPPEQVDNLIQMVADEAGLAVGFSLDNAGPVGTSVPQRKHKYFTCLSIYSLVV